MDLRSYPQTFTKLNINQVLSETLNEALERDDDNKWDDAIQNEYNSLIKNNTWNLTKLPLKRYVIGCKWVFCIKYKVDGQIDKACFVTKKLFPSSRY